MTVAKSSSKSNKSKPDRTVRSGRPTKEQAEQITAHIVEVATKLFLESSFEAVSIDHIAAMAQISKQTFYARFASKEAVYVAVIRKGTDDLVTPALTESNRDGPIEAILVRIALELARRALGPAAIALERLVASEAHQFPELAQAYLESGVHTRDMIASMFASAMRDSQIRSADANYLAEQFIYAVVDGPNRAVVLSGKIVRAEKDLRERIARAVALFLDGCRDSAVRRG